MAAVMSPKPFSFPHNILQETRDLPTFARMENITPTKPSLPSISSLIHDIDRHAENGKLQPSISSSSNLLMLVTVQSTSPAAEQQRVSAGSHGSQPPTSDRLSSNGSPRYGLPPTPPLPGASSFDFGRRSPPGSVSPVAIAATQNNYFAPSPTTTNPEAYATQKSAYPPVPESHHWSASNSPTSLRRTSDESEASNSGASSKPDSAYPDPSASPYSGLAQQRPLPDNFPPTVTSPAQQVTAIDPQMAPAQYQHHHHYPVTNSPTYAPTTDRYQCPTCRKAFSRPSSLKIHTYSHTGEKPFKCKYDGCGKFFSVRSNMKRHEKGCHGVESTSTGGSSPKAS